MDIRKRRPYIDLVAIDHAAAVENAKLGLCEMPPPLDSRLVRAIEAERPSDAEKGTPGFAIRVGAVVDGEKAPVVPEVKPEGNPEGEGNGNGQQPEGDQQPGNESTGATVTTDGNQTADVGAGAVVEEEEQSATDEKGDDAVEAGKSKGKRKSK